MFHRYRIVCAILSHTPLNCACAFVKGKCFCKGICVPCIIVIISPRATKRNAVLLDLFFIVYIFLNIFFQLSYADTNPILSDRSTYPHFFRTVPSDSDFNPARIQLLRHFNWTRVGTLFQDASKGSSRYAYVSVALLILVGW